MIGPLGHFLRQRDDGPLRLLRDNPLGIKDAVLEGLAKLCTRGIMLAQKALAQTSEHLRQHHTGTAPGTELCSSGDPAAKAANAVILSTWVPGILPAPFMRLISSYSSKNSL